MPSEQTTPLGLNLWSPEDRPKREDFNRDNERIDEACRSALDGLTEHLENGRHPGEEKTLFWDQAAAHTGEEVVSREGIHGLRYWNDALEVNLGGVWTPVSTGEPAPAWKVYGVCIENTPDSHPAEGVTYTDDALGMEPGGAEWEGTFPGSLRPCLLREGTVVSYLNPDNFAQRADGTAADITSGAEGDVMIEIPRMALAVYSEGDLVYVKVTNHPDPTQLDPRFRYPGHTRKSDGDRLKLYVGAYSGSEQDGRLRSLSGKAPVEKKNFSACRQLARARGSGWDLLGFYPYTLLQALLLIRFKTRDLQTAVGYGRVMEFTGTKPTGATDALGMFSGGPDQTQRMKAMGLEDLWGNTFQFLDGIRTDGNYGIYTAYGDFEEEGSWTLAGTTQKQQGYIGKVWGNNELGLLLRECTASGYDQGWCDGGSMLERPYVYCGGDWMSGRDAGPFGVYAAETESSSAQGLGTRLMYL